MQKRAAVEWSTGWGESQVEEKEVEEVLRLVEAVYVEEVKDDVDGVKRCGWRGRYIDYTESRTLWVRRSGAGGARTAQG
jgi:hypothetical protein